MKKVFFNIVLVVLGCLYTFSQGCLPEGISFQSQVQVDSFQYQYPGCTKIEGSVFINGDVYNLHGLNVLKSIEGDLTLDCVPLIDMTGLDSITHIGGNLGFFETQFVNMTGLGSLDSIGGSLTIGCETNAAIICNNPFLVNLLGLYELKNIGGNLLIQHCASLTSLNGLSSLTSVSGIIIKSNPILTSITGMANIDAGSVNSLTISNNSSLSQCHVQSICSYLGNPGGDVNIYGNAAGCRNPLEVADSCGIILACLPYGNYWLNAQSDIDNFGTNYPGCRELGGSVYIIGSDIANLNGLDSVTSIAGSLIIGHEWFGGGNPFLESLTGLGNIDSIGGILHIQYNHLLINMSGMENLSFIGGSFNLTGNDGMVNLTGLESLTSIGSGIGISRNDALIDLSGLNQVTSVGGYILIRLNDALSSLSGIENIMVGSIDNLSIYFNDILSDCAVQSICDYLVSPNGTIDIANNAPGCNSPEEVEAACAVSVDEISLPESFSIFPNPANNRLTIQLSLEKPEPLCVILLNVSGQQMAVVADERIKAGEYKSELDISNWPAGVYCCQVQIGNEMVTKKIIKL
jgi:hypothetical protein